MAGKRTLLAINLITLVVCRHILRRVGRGRQKQCKAALNEGCWERCKALDVPDGPRKPGYAIYESLACDETRSLSRHLVRHGNY